MDEWMTGKCIPGHQLVRRILKILRPEPYLSIPLSVGRGLSVSGGIHLPLYLGLVQSTDPLEGERAKGGGGGGTLCHIPATAPLLFFLVRS